MLTSHARLLLVHIQQAPTTSPTEIRTPPPTEDCICCTNGRRFGDYFQVSQGGYRTGGFYASDAYSDGDVYCTTAFLDVGTSTLDLPRNICEVKMLVVGGESLA